MSKVLNLLAWTCTALLAFLTIGALNVSAHGPTALLALASIASCPVFWSVLSKRGYDLQTGWKVTAAAAFFVFGMKYYPTVDVNEPGKPVQVAKAPAMPVKAPPPAPTKAEQIASLSAKEAKLAPEDFERRLPLLERLVELSDDSPEYQAKLDKVLSDKALADKIREHPEECFELVRYKGTKAGFGNVLLADLTIRNYGLSHLKDFVIECDLSGPSGTVMDRNSLTLYEMVEAGQTRRFREVSMGLINTQATRTNCRIMSASIA